MPITGEAIIRVSGDVSGATGALNTLNTSLKNAAGATDALKNKTLSGTDQLKGLAGGAADVVRQMTGLNIGMIGVAGGIAMAGKAIIDTTRAAMKYGLQIGDLSTKLGVTTEEASKFYQIADDLRIPTQSLELGFRMLTKNGIQPNMENMMRLADEYNAIVDPVQRAQFAMDNFGARAGLEMSRMLDIGREGMQKMGDEAERLGLVIDEKAVVASKKFYEMLDKVKDRLEGVKVALGGGIISFLVAEGEAMDAAAVATDKRRLAAEWLLERGINPIPQAVSAAVVAMELERAALDVVAIAAGNAAQETGFVKAAIDSLQDKTVVLTTVHRNVYEDDANPQHGLNVTVVSRYQDSNGAWWKRMSDGSVVMGRAQGGQLGPITEVGEEGTEGIIGNQVIPHNKWEQMKRSGVVATRRMRLGGEVESGGLGYMPKLAPKPKTTTSKDISIVGDYSSAFDTGSTSIIASAAATAAGAAAESAAVKVATAMPQAIGQAVSQQTAQQVQIQIAGNAANASELRAIRRQLQTMNSTFVRAVRDAVASL
jgi:hypothetical protein